MLSKHLKIHHTTTEQVLWYISK